MSGGSIHIKRAGWFWWRWEVTTNRYQVAGRTCTYRKAERSVERALRLMKLIEEVNGEPGR